VSKTAAIAGRYIRVRRIVMETWLVYRVNPVTGEIDTYELTCEQGTFLANYRLLGHIDDNPTTTEVATRFDPMVDDWDRDLLATWTEVSETRVR
jgi:hypothetical protein